MTKPFASVTLVCLCLLFGLARFGYVGEGQTFAADLGATRSGSASTEPLGRVYVSHGKVRIETRDLPDGFFIVDALRPAAWFLRPRQRVFMDARRSSPLTQIFVRVEPTDACRQWRMMEDIAGASAGQVDWRCDLVGPDLINGQDTLKYRVIARDTRESYRWVDPLRQFPVQVENADGTRLSLESIVDALQPSTLFAVPVGYRKFDPLQLIEQIKQSDVWVEPRK